MDCNLLKKHYKHYELDGDGGDSSQKIYLSIIGWRGQRKSIHVRRREKILSMASS